MKSYAFLFWAYNVIWIGIAGYLLFLFTRIRGMSRKLEALERDLSRRGD